MKGGLQIESKTEALMPPNLVVICMSIIARNNVTRIQMKRLFIISLYICLWNPFKGQIYFRQMVRQPYFT